MKKAFTLIELIVWITISMLLMVSVWIFINNWMKNIFDWQKVLENTDNFLIFSESLKNSINLIETWSINPTNTSSWILYKRWLYFWEWWFSYIWTKNLNQKYCNNDSDSPNLNHIYIKNFIPYEENWEDLFSNYNSILSSTSWDYTSYQKENIVKKSDWTIVVWKWIWWNKFIEWANWTDIYLNSPTWLTSDGTNLYISDTLNNRIIYLDSSNKVHLLLDENDWLNEPTWLYYKDSEKALYIANSWNWEILKYSSKDTSAWLSPTLTLSWFTINNVSKIDITFTWASTNVSLINYNTNNFTLTNNSTSTDYLTWTTNRLKYYLVDYSSTNSFQPICIWSTAGQIKLNASNNPIKCSSSWTWNTSIYKPITISNIEVKRIKNTSNTWSYYAKLTLKDSLNNILYQKYLPYFTQGDDKIYTKKDNTLSIYKSWLKYPIWIWENAWTITYNEFWDWTYWNLDYNNYDKLLNIPVKSLDIANDMTNKLLTIFLKYYKSYNCYNIDEKVERTYILKKNLK